jgi:hypothetical protein
MKNKGDTPMHTESATETITDRAAILSPKQVRDYMEPTLGGKPVKTARSGHTEYNNGDILVKSKHPMDQCLKRGIIEDRHHWSAKKIRNYHDCAFSTLGGRTYNATGEGDPEMDAATVYAIVSRTMRRRDWELISLVCFPAADIDGNYYSEIEYQYLLKLAPNIRYAFEASDDAFDSARGIVKKRIEEERKRLEEAKK